MKTDVYQELYETKISTRNFPRENDYMNSTQGTKLSKNSVSDANRRSTVKKQTFENVRLQMEKKKIMESQICSESKFFLVF